MEIVLKKWQPGDRSFTRWYVQGSDESVNALFADEVIEPTKVYVTSSGIVSDPHRELTVEARKAIMAEYDAKIAAVTG